MAIKYRVTPTGRDFHNSKAEIRGVLGPFGSGKSIMCAEELLFISMGQEKAADGNRYTRHGIIRATYPLLDSATKVTMEEVWPGECGRIKSTVPMTGTYRIPLPDDSTAVVEIIMMAVQTEDDIKKLRSLNLTCIWISEPTEVAGAVLEASLERIGRYPTGEKGQCSFSGVIMEFNKPVWGHWLTKLMDNPPDKYEFFIQPPAMFKVENADGSFYYEANPNAENLENLDGGVGYYYRQVALKTANDKEDEIDSLLCLTEADDKSGKPVWPKFSRDKHILRSEVKPELYTDVLIGMDTSGIHPAAVIAQFIKGNWIILDEVYGDGSGFKEFLDLGLIPILRTRYSTCNHLVIGDPANAKDGYTGLTPIQHLQAAGIEAIVAQTNKPSLRIESVATMLNKHEGGFLFNPSVKLVIAACAGGYKYRKHNLVGTVEAVYSTTPIKNQHSHPADALQYLALYIEQGNREEEVDEKVRAVMAARAKAKRRMM